MSDPYSDFKQENLGNLQNVLNQLAKELKEAEKAVEQKEKELAEAKEFFRDLSEKRVPEAADGVTGQIKLESGEVLEIKEHIRASIAGAKRIPAIKWLDENGFGNIVKRKIIIELGKDDDRRAKLILQSLKEIMDVTGEKFVIKQDYSVHPQTLVAWVKEMMAEGIEIPVEVFGIFRQTIAKVKE